MNNDLIFQMALTQVPNIGHVHAKTLTSIFGTAEAIFNAPKNKLEKIDGIGQVRASSIKSFSDFKSCENEIRFTEQHHIKPIFINDTEYPKRLLNCYDSPILLYFKGNTSLNNPRFVSVVGTRANTDYGKIICEQFIDELKPYNITVISGLAYGIDTIAHKSALKNNLATIGILAHGLDRIYPYSNKSMAKQMIENGGLLTEYPSGTNPDKQNFPERNRITAGICDALVVIETGKSGGSLITAEIANSYNKDVFAFPGRINDVKSDGCNRLIKNNKACLISSAEDLVNLMGWNEKKSNQIPTQRSLFNDLNNDELLLMKLLEELNETDIDTLTFKSGLSHSSIAVILLTLEINGLIKSLPGKRYKSV
jgi:DNA processing protein